jgi:NAD(P)-dependent dehydrogenase (short-subunit alcohol dehydrogenase family)
MAATGSRPMTKKLCVVTGANAGIGKAIALALTQAGLRVVMVCRDAQKGAQAAAEIKTAVPDNPPTLLIGDLGSIAGVRQIAADLLAQYPQIHILINNAGVWATKRKLNADGLETSFMVNHLAPFLLTNLLLERLQASRPARIVNINAGLYVKGQLDLEKTPYGHDFHSLKSYANTKLANVLFTQELARRLEGSGVTVNAIHPGVIRTELGNRSGPLGWLLKLIKRSWKTPEEGAKSPVWLATAAELEGVNGRYYNEFEEIPIDPVAQDEALTQQLWQFSETLSEGMLGRKG